MNMEATCLKCGSVIELEPSDVSPGQVAVVCPLCGARVPLASAPPVAARPPISVELVSVALPFRAVFLLACKAVASLFLLCFLLASVGCFLFFLLRPFFPT